MDEYMIQLSNLMFLLVNNQIKNINHINRLGYAVMKSKNDIYIKSYLDSVSWNQIDENLLIELIASFIEKKDKETINRIIKKLYTIKKYNIIEKIYFAKEYDKEIINKVIVNNTRKFITSNYYNEDIYDEFLDNQVFLGLLCDMEADQANIDRSFELVKHIKPKKNIKTLKNV